MTDHMTAAPKSLLCNLSSLVWLVLTGTTALSWWLGTRAGAGESSESLHQATTVILALAFFKVWLVLRHFMEVRHAPLALRLITDAWVIGVGGVVLGLYWWA